MDNKTTADDLVILQKRLAERYPIGLATIGNSFRSDDNIAARVCDALPTSALNQVCRYDLGTYTSFLGECLRKHKAAIVIDATENGTAPGTITVLNMTEILSGEKKVRVSSSHGFSFLDELRIYSKDTKLPSPFFFFGIEAKSVDWSNDLSTELEIMLPDLAKLLTVLIGSIAQTAETNARS
jgi:hydrogenase maturation protease